MAFENYKPGFCAALSRDIRVLQENLKLSIRVFTPKRYYFEMV